MNTVELNGGEKRTFAKTVYNQCIWILKDYPRLVELAELEADKSYSDDDLLLYTDECEGLISRDVVNEAKFKIECIESSLACIPEYYRNGIFNHVVDGLPYNDEANINTWKSWKRKFLMILAKKLNLY